MTEAYGQRLGEALRVENAPSIVTRALRAAEIAVTEIRYDNPLPEMCGPLQREDPAGTRATLTGARLARPPINAERKFRIARP